MSGDASRNGAARRIPWSEEAEVSVLGAMIIDRDSVAVAMEDLDESAFYREGNRRVFRAMRRIFERGGVVEAVAVADELQSSGDLEAVGGSAYLARLVGAVPHTASFSQHCSIIREKATLRRLIESATDIIDDAYTSPAGEVSEALDRAEQRIFEIAGMERRGGFVRVKELVAESLTGIDRRMKTPGMVTGTPTGIDSLDNLTAGFQKSDLIVLAARPSMGKTALALNMALHVAISRRMPVAIFSLEMSREALVQRMLCSESKVDHSHVRIGRLNDEEYDRLARGAGHLHTAPIWIDDTPVLAPIELRAKLRRLIADSEAGDVGLVIIDYLQLMTGSRRTENRQQEISDISRALKAISRETSVPVMALSQLSRAPERRDDSRPRLSDLRESGAIEQDADVVLFIYREEMHSKPEEIQEKNLQGKAELIIGKQRNGPTGRVDLFFHKEFTTFREIDRRREEAGAAL